MRAIRLNDKKGQNPFCSLNFRFKANRQPAFPVSYKSSPYYCFSVSNRLHYLCEKEKLLSCLVAHLVRPFTADVWQAAVGSQPSRLGTQKMCRLWCLLPQELWGSPLGVCPLSSTLTLENSPWFGSSVLGTSMDFPGCSVACMSPCIYTSLVSSFLKEADFPSPARWGPLSLLQEPFLFLVIEVSPEPFSELSILVIKWASDQLWLYPLPGYFQFLLSRMILSLNAL